jgi:hypothetical protein
MDFTGTTASCSYLAGRRSPLAGGELAEEVEMVHLTLERTVGTITLTVSATRRNCTNEKIFFLYF